MIWEIEITTTTGRRCRQLVVATTRRDAIRTALRTAHAHGTISERLDEIDTLIVYPAHDEPEPPAPEYASWIV